MPSLTKSRAVDADEERVTRAQHLLIGLGAALVHRPFDPAVHERLLAFLSDEAASVLASLHVLEQRPEHELRRRIAELAGHHLVPSVPGVPGGGTA
ncbi:hypothetical protein ABR738_01395 [Streptomyces sp. Edi4]|uniref:hypothetical protein n=1 Tax=Streptomyces sp. Edi4 TaxID=3162527 RepID=UPI0033067717